MDKPGLLPLFLSQHLRLNGESVFAISEVLGMGGGVGGGVAPTRLRQRCPSVVRASPVSRVGGCFSTTGHNVAAMTDPDGQRQRR